MIGKGHTLMSIAAMLALSQSGVRIGGPEFVKPDDDAPLPVPPSNPPAPRVSSYALAPRHLREHERSALAAAAAKRARKAARRMKERKA